MDYQLELDWDHFLATYWQKRPVVLKQAFKHFADPITPDELAGLAMENEVDSRLVSYKNGQWQAEHGPFETFDHLGETGWSLLAQAVNHWHLPSAALVTPFRVLPDRRGRAAYRPVRRLHHPGHGPPPLAGRRKPADAPVLPASRPAACGPVHPDY